MDAAQSMSFEKILASVRRSGLRLTRPREAMLRVLLRQRTPMTMREIRRSAGRGDAATVYRSLKALEKAGVVRRCDFGDGCARFEISLSEDAHGHHIRCRICKKIEPIDYCGLENVEIAIERVLKYSRITHSLEFFGVCPDCAKRDG